MIEKIKSKEFQDDIAGSPVEKSVPIYVAGSWVGVQTTDSPYGSSVEVSESASMMDTLFLDHYLNRQLYTRLFYTTTPIAGQTWIPHVSTANKLAHKKPTRENERLAYVFLKVNDFFFIDFLDFNSDTLVRRYYIKRINVRPSLDEKQTSEAAVAIANSLVNSQQMRPLVAPDQVIPLALDKSDILPDSLVRYDLVSDKGTSDLHYIAGKKMLIPPLQEDSEYSIRLHYSMQPESVTEYKFRTSPYWYHSSTFYTSSGVLLSILALLFVATISRRKLKKYSKIQTETEVRLKIIQSQLNPHFMFNSLNSIQGLINTNRIDEANFYLQEFSMFLRKTLQDGDSLLNTLDKEIEMMRSYISLEKLRFDFDSELKISDAINISSVEIPTLLLQPIIENAIKHGIAGLGSNGKLIVECKTGNEEQDLIISIKDNGKGFPKSSSDGYGLKLTKKRIETFNSLQSDKKIELNFRNSFGAEAVFTFYNWVD